MKNYGIYTEHNYKLKYKCTLSPSFGYRPESWVHWLEFYIICLNHTHCAGGYQARACHDAVNILKGSSDCSIENGWQPGKIKSIETRCESPKIQNRNDSDLSKGGSSADRKK